MLTSLLLSVSVLLLSVFVLLPYLESQPASVLRDSGLAVWRDELPHHHVHHNNDVFFEGWYYKLVGPYTDDIIAVIPGLFINRVNRSSSEAFVMVVHNTNVNYFRFPPEKFKDESHLHNNTLYITIGDNIFTSNSILVSLVPQKGDDATDIVVGEVEIINRAPWLTRFLHPSTMGVFGWLPGLQCYHSVLSMFSELHGYISVGNQLTDLEMGTGYVEKDWGRDFPSTWVWSQSNHFVLIKPRKRKGAAEDGEIWADTEENVESVSDDGPGAGEASGAISALYADHVLNHIQPVSLFLSIAKVPLLSNFQWMAPLLNSVGLTSDAYDFPGFIVGWLYDKKTHVFATYQLDLLDQFEVKVDERDREKETLEITVVNREKTKKLCIQIHKPVIINKDKIRKKNQECLKNQAYNKKRQAERLGTLNPLEEAFLMDDVMNTKGDADKAVEPPSDSKDNKPDYAEPVVTPAPIHAHLYAPHDGKMDKYVRESLVGGRIEAQFYDVITADAYAQLSSKQKRQAQANGAEWKQCIVGSNVMYESQLYRGIGKPAGMEIMGDVDWLIEETEKRKMEWNKSWFEWAMKPTVLFASFTTLILLMLPSFLLALLPSSRRFRSNKDIAANYDAWTQDKVLEKFWGEHIHHGYYENGNEDFKQAKSALIEKLIAFSGLAPTGSNQLLDVGCGVGGSGRYLAQKGWQVTGVTLSVAQQSRAQYLNKKAGVSDKVKIEIADALALPYPDASFDAVWVLESAEHFSSKAQFIQQLLRVLKPGGRFVIATWMCSPNINHKSSDMQTIYHEWSLPQFVTQQEYDRLFQEHEQKTQSADWSTHVQYTWEHSVREGWKGLAWLLFQGPRVFFRTLRDLKAVNAMTRGYKKGDIKYGVITGIKQ